MPPEPDVNPARQDSEQSYASTPVVRPEHAEDAFTRVLEQQAAKIPSDVFLFSAIGAMGLSFLLHLGGRRDSSRFVGMWAPTFLTMGIYNKMVKMGPQ